MARAFRRRSLSMTSLIDVIFLLLMFFMLSTSFTRSTELPLSAAHAAPGAFADAKLVFVRLGAAGISVNGRSVAPEALVAQIQAQAGAAARVLVALEQGEAGPRAQALADLLVILRGAQGFQVQVLG